MIATPDTIYEDESTVLRAIAVGEEADDVCDDDEVRVEITPEGFFKRSITVKYGELKEGIVLKREEEGELAGVIHEYTVRLVVREEEKGSKGIYVKSKPCVIFRKKEQEVKAGETVEIEYELRQKDGSICRDYDRDICFWIGGIHSRGSLIEVETGMEGEGVCGRGKFLYRADENIVEDTIYAYIIPVEPNGCEGDFTYMEMRVLGKSGCVNVWPERDTVRIGEQVRLMFEGSIGPYDVYLVGPEGETGSLVSDGQTGTTLYGVTEPVHYIAPEEISGEAVPVQFWAKVHKSDNAISARVDSRDTLK